MDLYPKGRGWSRDVCVFVCMHTHFVFPCKCMLPVRVHSVCIRWCLWGGVKWVLCVLWAFAGKDGRRLLMLDFFQTCSQNYSHGQRSLVHCPPLVHINLLVSVSATPDLQYPSTCTHIPLCFVGLTRKRIICQHLCSSVLVCLLPKASGTPGPELPLLLSSLLSSFFVFFLLLCLAVMSPVSLEVYSYE